MLRKVIPVVEEEKVEAVVEGDGEVKAEDDWFVRILNSFYHHQAFSKVIEQRLGWLK